MRVLLVTCEDPGNPLGGMGVFIREFSQELQKQCEMRVLLLDSGQYEDVSSLVDYVVRPDIHFAVTGSEGALLTSAHSVHAQVMQILGNWKPDVIHCNDRQTYLPFMYSKNVVFSLHLSLPDMFGLRNIDDRWYQELKIEQAAAKNAHAFCVYSDFYRNRVLENISPYASPLKLPLGIHPDRYYSRKNSTKKIISFFGRLVQYQKGIDFFMDAVNRFSCEYLQQHDVEFRLYGKTRTPERFSHPNIAAVQFVDGDDKYAAFAETDIVVMPSTYEPFGFVGIEAIASGCLLLAPVGLGMDEYLLSEHNFVAIHPDPDSIHTTLDQLIQNWNTVEEYQQKSAETVQHWTWQRCVRKHMEIYDAVLTGRILHHRAVNSALAQDVLRWRVQELELRTSPEQIKTAMEQAHGRILFVGAPAEAVPESECYTGLSELLPYADNSFDTVIAVHEIEYGVDVHLALAEMTRVSTSHIVLAVTIGSARHHQVFQFDTIADMEEQLLPFIDMWQWSFKQEGQIVWIYINRFSDLQLNTAAENTAKAVNAEIKPKLARDGLENKTMEVSI